MASTSDGLERTVSAPPQLSDIPDEPSSSLRLRAQKSTSVSGASTPTVVSDKSFTSFPSLSPTNSPETGRDMVVLEPIGLPDPPVRKRMSIVESLTEMSPNAKRRASLFEDNPMHAHVPGALHLASDDHIERLIARHGAVQLVRQLAEDLASRDTQMSTFRRKQDERERILRRMLLDCDVRSIYIDEQLKLQTGTDRVFAKGNKSRISLGAESLNDMMNEAMNEPVAGEEGDSDDLGYIGLGIGGGSRKKGADADSAHATDDKAKRGGGWKEYFLGTGKKSKASSIADSVDEEDISKNATIRGPPPRRKGLQSEQFKPLVQTPSEAALRAVSMPRPKPVETSESESDKAVPAKAGVTSWAMKFVSGTQPKNGTVRSRGSSETAVPPRPASASTASTKPTPSTVKGLTKGTVKAHRRSMNSGPNGTVKPAPDLRVMTSPNPDEDPSNLGPVEMDRIVSPTLRPPALTPGYDRLFPSEYAIDRFGYIYDQKRRTRQKEAAADNLSTKSFRTEMLSTDPVDEMSDSSSENHSRPVTPASGTKEDKIWYSFLRLYNGPTELLSHTPAPQVTTAVIEAKTPPKSPGVSVSVGDNLTVAPATAITGSSTATAGLFTTLKPLSTPTLPMDHVDSQDSAKALLEQVTDLHENLQKDKTVRWNEFLRKVRAERRREDEAASSESRPDHRPEHSLADGEVIGIAGLGNKGKTGRAKWNEFKALVLAGIPVVYRAKIWAECSGAAALRVPGYYDDLVSTPSNDQLVESQIAMDIRRTLTDNIFFRQGPGVQKLEEVLLAYSQRNPEVGYCQGMNMIAGSLLLILPTAEDVFWVLATMIEEILPKNYYDHSLLASRADQRVLRSYVSEILPRLSEHLDELGIELEALTFQWFLSVFTDCLSAEALFRVWDVVLCMNDGSTFLFQVALALLKLNEQALLACESPASVYTYINHNMTNHAISIDGLIRASDALKKDVRRVDVEERRDRAIELELEEMKARSARKGEMVARRKASEAAAEEMQIQAASATAMVISTSSAGQSVSSISEGAVEESTQS